MMKIQDLFEPLSVKYCDYFYYLSVIFFLITCMTVLSLLMNVVQGKNKMKLSKIAIVVSQPLILYFINRLNYSICVGALN
ncbi:MAG: hypothetical protein L7S72_01220 [Flavobacteriales bacterium]|nr:hypothetical protein [Flavobacteriales bacterium]